MTAARSLLPPRTGGPVVTGLAVVPAIGAIGVGWTVVYWWCAAIAAALLACWAWWRRPWCATGCVLAIGGGVAFPDAMTTAGAVIVAALVAIFLVLADAAESAVSLTELPAWLGCWRRPLVAAGVGIAAAVAGDRLAVPGPGVGVVLGAAAAGALVWAAVRRT